MNEPTAVSDRDRLMFGAGFAFGVTCLFLVLAMVVAGATGSDLTTGTPVLGSVVVGALAAGVIGAALFLLAFPENRVQVPFVGDLDDESA